MSGLGQELPGQLGSETRARRKHEAGSNDRRMHRNLQEQVAWKTKKKLACPPHHVDLHSRWRRRRHISTASSRSFNCTPGQTFIRTC